MTRVVHSALCHAPIGQDSAILGDGEPTLEARELVGGSLGIEIDGLGSPRPIEGISSHHVAAFSFSIGPLPAHEAIDDLR